MIRAAIYLRVSTAKKVIGPALPCGGRIEDRYLQNPAVQRAPLVKLVRARGWKLPVHIDTLNDDPEKVGRRDGQERRTWEGTATVDD